MRKDWEEVDEQQRVLTTIPANIPLPEAEKIIETLIERALRAKQALDREPGIKVRAEQTQSEFAAVFAPEVGNFLSAEEMHQPNRQKQMVRVAAYIRVSTDSEDQENSYEAQANYFMHLLCVHPGWMSAGIYSDYGISGTNEQKRTGYRRLLRHCAEGRIDRIICKSISRFARNTRDFMAALALLKEQHVSILFEKEGIDTQERTNEFILTTLAAIAQEESRAISSNIRWSIQKRFPQGQVRNYPVYGYRFVTGHHAMEEVAGYQIRRVEIVEEEAKIVQQVFAWAEDGMSCVGMARRLNREGVRAPNHGKTARKVKGRSNLRADMESGWTGAMIARMLAQEKYCGDALLQKTYTPDFLTHASRRNVGEIPKYLVHNHHPAIIDRALFLRVQEVRANTYHRGGSLKTPRAFSGRLICAHCGRAYNVRISGRKTIWYCPTSVLNNGRGLCFAEKVEEQQLVRMLRKAFIARFQLLDTPLWEEGSLHAVLCGNCSVEDALQLSWNYCAQSFVVQMRLRLEEIQHMDYMERDREMLKRQCDALEQHLRETADAEEKASLRVKIQKKEAQIKHLEAYWEQGEWDYEEREKALAWMRQLPDGPEGTIAFLQGLTGEHVKAFVLAITVHTATEYAVQWFDDTRTEINMQKRLQGKSASAGG